MRSQVWWVCLLAVACGPVFGADLRLDGDWIVDLSTDPKEPYSKPMQLVLHDDGRVEGSFYESTIDAGRWRQDRGRVCASFRTSDGVGPYHSAVCLDGDIARGQTWAEHRNFLFNWNATRAPSRVAPASPELSADDNARLP